ncbi:MAG TPA: hypothetical protein VKD72_20880 [Gemmataceae bacterium]|nr:hypothetical protein [Gemmataceae bacterium]
MTDSSKPRFNPTEEQRRDIVARYQAGESICELARSFGVQDDTIRRFLTRQNVPLRSVSEAVRLKRSINDGLTNQQRRTARAIADRRCRSCRTAPVAPRRRLCESCLAASRNRSAQRRAAGLCHGCGEPSTAPTCPSCRAGMKSWRQELRDAVLDAYGRSCACCGETLVDTLCIDHINGGGSKERRAGLTGYTFYRWLKANGFPPGFETLCGACNLAKRNKSECPHQAQIRQMLEHIAKIPLTY